MLAVIGAVLIALAAFNVKADFVDLFILGLAFWAFHFGWDHTPWTRRG